MKINWTVRGKHPLFWISLIGVIGNTALTYFGLNASDLTSWAGLADILIDTVKNPCLLGSIFMAAISAVGIAVDPTTPGASDSVRALNRTEPKED